MTDASQAQSSVCRIAVRIDGQVPRRWHVDLMARLSQRPGLLVQVDARPGPRPLPVAAAHLFRFETLLHGADGPGAAATPVAAAALDAWRGDAEVDLVIDLCGDAEGPRVWRLFYDGAAGEAGLLASVLAGASPQAEIRDGAHRVAAGRLGAESIGIVQAAFADALTRTATLILAALDGAPTMAPDDWASSRPDQTFGTAQLAARIGRKLVGTAGRRLYRLCYHTPQWRVGWRRLDGPDMIDLRDHPKGGWRVLPDDRRRFYADPFPIEIDGEVTLFVEEYPHATRKGIISAVAFGPEGPRGTPEPVLELPYHLSYPFVFARDGEIWMIPESGAAGTIDLFRATRFPGGWVKHATLVAGVVASDATLFEHDGVWWMFASVRDGGGGSTSDTLHLWRSADFRGPWRPHARNPVLIDNAAARPGGRMVERDGVIWRPAQDCRRAYGGALALARVLELDDERFVQEVETVVTAGPRWPGHLLHTLNRAGPFEFIDGSGHARRF